MAVWEDKEQVLNHHAGRGASKGFKLNQNVTPQPYWMLKSSGCYYGKFDTKSVQLVRKSYSRSPKQDCV